MSDTAEGLQNQVAALKTTLLSLHMERCAKSSNSGPDADACLAKVAFVASYLKIPANMLSTAQVSHLKSEDAGSITNDASHLFAILKNMHVFCGMYNAHALQYNLRNTVFFGSCR